MFIQRTFSVVLSCQRMNLKIYLNERTNIYEKTNILWYNSCDSPDLSFNSPLYK